MLGGRKIRMRAPWAALGMAVFLGGPLAAPPAELAGSAAAGTAVNIGRLLFRDFLLPFEVTSVLVLIAIMGAVVLTRRGEE